MHDNIVQVYPTGVMTFVRTTSSSASSNEGEISDGHPHPVLRLCHFRAEQPEGVSRQSAGVRHYFGGCPAWNFDAYSKDVGALIGHRVWSL